VAGGRGGVRGARAAGIPCVEVLRTRVLDPLGMHDTGFWTTDVERLATAYQPTADALTVWEFGSATLGGRGWGLGTSVVLEGPGPAGSAGTAASGRRSSCTRSATSP
jgi:CubicO group peptidase (beta-lactamase class C family)